MKKLTTAFSLALACILCLWQVTTAQTTGVTREKWQQEMNDEEVKIERFVESQMSNPLPAIVRTTVDEAMEHEHLDKNTRKEYLQSVARDHYRQQYFRLHPEARKIYNPGRVTDHLSSGNENTQYSNKTTSLPTTITCQHGDFESSVLSPYLGFTGSYSPSGDCSSIPLTNVSYTPTAIPSTDNFLLTNNIPDPIVAALNQTNGGSSHALRINAPSPCSPGAKINMVQRTFNITAGGHYEINFSYALVMENPLGHGGQQPFFLARVLDPLGNEVGSRICRVSDMTNPFYQIINPDTSGLCNGSYENIVWRDWTCASIDFNVGSQGGAYTIEFFMADCQATAHFGYAYIDDICAQQCCPKFIIQNCCDLQGGTNPPRYNQDQTVKSVLANYKAVMDRKYGAGAADDACCDPCKYPNDPFPIFIIGEDGYLISSSDYSISWSHDAGNTSAWSYILPGQQTVVTVTGPGNCVWRDTFKLDCCEDTINIIGFCPWDPCEHPESKFPLKVEDPTTSTVLTTGAGYTFLWTYGTSTSTGDAITAAPVEFPVYVEVTYPDGCVYYDTFDIDCCKPETPKNTYCKTGSTGYTFGWDPVPGAAYYTIEISVNDPACCRQGNPYAYRFNVYGTDTTVSISPLLCFSWKVASVCPDNSSSPFTAPQCCMAPPSCNPPTSLKCQSVITWNGTGFVSQRKLSWTPPSGSTVLGYELQIIYGDPACCRTVMSYITTLSTTNTYIYTSPLSCFSWKVRAICPSGTRSAWVSGGCSCGGFVVTDKIAQKGSANDEDQTIEDHLPTSEIEVLAAPNPASSFIEFSVQLKNPENYAQGQLTVALFDLSGREVKTITLENAAKTKMDIREVAAGTYFYTVKVNNQPLFADKIVIMKE